MQTNPVKAIRDWCLECSGGSHESVKMCSSTDCPLYPFRQGRNPYRTARKLTDEQRAAAAANLAHARKALSRKQTQDEETEGDD